MAGAGCCGRHRVLMPCCAVLCCAVAQVHAHHVAVLLLGECLRSLKALDSSLGSAMLQFLKKVTAHLGMIYILCECDASLP